MLQGEPGMCGGMEQQNFSFLNQRPCCLLSQIHLSPIGGDLPVPRGRLKWKRGLLLATGKSQEAQCSF